MLVAALKNSGFMMHLLGRQLHVQEKVVILHRRSFHVQLEHCTQPFLHSIPIKSLTHDHFSADEGNIN